MKVEMKICQVTLTKDFLRNLEEKERRILIHCAHTLNELNTLSKLFRLSTMQPNSEPERQLMLMQSMCLLRLLAGKMYESWSTFENLYFGSGLSHSFNARLGTESAAILKNLKRYFSQNSAIKTIRHMYAFHYDAASHDHGIAALPEDSALDIFFDKSTENTVYGFAEYVISHSAFSTISEDLEKAADILMNETSEKCNQFQKILSACIDSILFPKNPSVKGKLRMTHEHVSSTKWEDAKLSLFLENPKPFTLKLDNGEIKQWTGGHDMQSELLKELFELSGDK